MVQDRLDPCFVADMMLGKLARWMRVLGYDVWYKNPWQGTHYRHMVRTLRQRVEVEEMQERLL